MDKNLDAKLKGIVAIAEKIRKVEESIADKTTSLDGFEKLLPHLSGLPAAEASCKDTIEQLKKAIAEEETLLAEYKKQL